MTTQYVSQVEKDALLIEKLGGPAKVADLLDFKDEIGTQRVYNWTKRGIPSQIRIDHPEIFMAAYVKSEAA